MAALALGGAAGCGEDNDNDEAADPKADARGAVADFAGALGNRDAEAACESLTADAQEQVGTQIAKTVKERPGECSDVLGAVFDSPRTADALTRLADLSEQIRSGDLEDGEVNVAIFGNKGTVTLPAGDSMLPVPVGRVSGEWLVSDARGLLFGFGTGG